MREFAGGARRIAACVIALTGAAGLAACGADDSRDIDERAATYAVAVSDARFAPQQRVAADEDLRLTVRNTGREDIPQLTVTVSTRDRTAGAVQAQASFDTQLGPQAGAATRPVWVPTAGFPKALADGASAADLAAAPAGGAAAAQPGTYVFGALPAGASRTLVWRVTPVRPGRYEVRYAVAAGVAGAAKAVGADGEPVGGSFGVRIGAEPEGACVVSDGAPAQPDC